MYGGARLGSFHFGVQIDVGDNPGPIYFFPEIMVTDVLPESQEFDRICSE